MHNLAKRNVKMDTNLSNIGNPMTIAGFILLAICAVPALGEPSETETRAFIQAEALSAYVHSFGTQRQETISYSFQDDGFVFQEAYADGTFYKRVDVRMVARIFHQFKPNGLASMQCHQNGSEFLALYLICMDGFECAELLDRTVDQSATASKSAEFRLVFCPDADGTEQRMRLANAFLHLNHLGGGAAELIDPEEIGKSFD